VNAVVDEADVTYPEVKSDLDLGADRRTAAGSGTGS
jgi:hypothetical protein